MTDTPLDQAVQAGFTELDRRIAWMTQLNTERAETKAKIDSLTKALAGLIAMLEGEPRRKSAARLAANTARARGKPFGGGQTLRSQAFQKFLETWPHPTMRPKDYMAFLRNEGLPPPDRQFAARVFSRKTAQGVLERVGTGEYRIV